MQEDEKRDYFQILFNLTADKTPQVTNFEDKLQQILDKTLPLLSEDDKSTIFSTNNTINDNLDIRYQYIKVIAYVLHKIQVYDTTSNDDCISVQKYRTFKVAIELIVSIGIIPCLLPGVGVDMKQLCPRAAQLSEEKTSILKKYERLCLTTNSLIEYYNGTTLRPAILSQLGPLIAALLQLSHAPLMKPCKDNVTLKQERINDAEFVMTSDLYKKLQNDRIEFLSKLQTILDNCPQYMVIKELMLILGLKGAPKWIRRETRKYLVEKIQQPHGVMSLIGGVCNDTLDFGTDWEKLEILARLIATSHEIDTSKYYEAVCPQLLDLLTSKEINHASIIANRCIMALYENDPSVCEKNILNVITKPLLANLDHPEKVEVMVQEDELNTCIENLWTCFNVTEAQFKTLPYNVMSVIAIPLFCIHAKVRSSAFILKNKVRDLLTKLLHDETLRNDLFAACLGYDTVTRNFGKYISTQFGSNGGLEVVKIEKNLPYEELADGLFDLVSPYKELTINLFSCLLKLLSNSMKCSYDKMLETPFDTIERIQKQLAAIKLLSHLANNSAVQEAQLKNPEPLLNFIKTLFVEHTRKNDNNGNDEYEIVYISLMLIKMILNSDSKMLQDRTSFESFATFLKEQISNSVVPPQLIELMKETVSLIECKQSNNRHFEDLSINYKQTSKFEEAIRDLSDPLLPVRAHGLITLTKLIETKDPITITRNSILLRLFQENLKHDDSFIYLAAINGMCALAVTYPTTIIETLVQEYIDMPQRIARAELTSETRVKLGEILVNTTRGLGEMVVAHKNVLINGFLCATRDPDPLVRASSLSCLGEFCKILGFRLGDIVIEVLYCINCIIETDKVPECRRAAVLVITLLLRGLGKHVLTSFSKDLVVFYRSLKHLWNNDNDPVLRLHAQLALEEIDEIVQSFLFAKPKLEKTVFLLEPSM